MIDTNHMQQTADSVVEGVSRRSSDVLNGTPVSTPSDSWVLKGQVSATGPMQRISVCQAPFLIGRTAACALSLDHPTVSGQHAALFEAGGLMLLRDLDSRNGTFLNGLAVTTPRPIRHGDLIQFAELAFLVDHKESNALAGDHHDTVSSQTIAADVGEQALALMQFEKLMQHDAIVPHYQPIVTIADRSTIASELLGRSRLVGLQTPNAMFRAAQQFDREVELSRLLRHVGVQSSRFLSSSDLLFVNTHPLEVGSQQLLRSLIELRKADRERELVLEIHEATIADTRRLTELRLVLNDLNIRLAYDDFGAGQTRLRELIDVRPDYLKFDMGLIRDIDSADLAKRHTVKSLVTIAKNLGITTLAEGVETETEHQACLEVGFDLGQGYLYGRPMTQREWVGYTE